MSKAADANVQSLSSWNAPPFLLKTSPRSHFVSFLLFPKLLAANSFRSVSSFSAPSPYSCFYLVVPNTLGSYRRLFEASHRPPCVQTFPIVSKALRSWRSLFEALPRQPFVKTFFFLLFPKFLTACKVFSKRLQRLAVPSSRVLFFKSVLKLREAEEVLSKPLQRLGVLFSAFFLICRTFFTVGEAFLKLH